MGAHQGLLVHTELHQGEDPSPPSESLRAGSRKIGYTSVLVLIEVVDASDKIGVYPSPYNQVPTFRAATPEEPLMPLESEPSRAVPAPQDNGLGGLQLPEDASRLLGSNQTPVVVIMGSRQPSQPVPGPLPLKQGGVVSSNASTVR